MRHVTICGILALIWLAAAIVSGLSGVKYKRLARTLFLDLVIFWGLHISGLQVKIAPAILYLMTGAFSAVSRPGTGCASSSLSPPESP